MNMETIIAQAAAHQARGRIGAGEAGRIVSGAKALAEFDGLRGGGRGYKHADEVGWYRPIAGGADGLFYWDTREPAINSDVAAVTLASTDKALYPVSNFPVLGGQYFTRIGKKIRVKLFGRMTTGATPGNGTIDVYYGTGADANGTILASSAAVALQASQTNLSWMIEVTVHVRSTGSAGTLFCTGWSLWNVALILSTAQPVLVPASAPVVSAAVDLTAANIISVQYKRSGSTAETMQVHDMEVVAMN